jgi:CelD/BcsL family acetyltransferase involved in cellulose biosynthesis
MHEAAALAGCLDVNLLYVDGEPIAFAYNYVLNGAVSGLRMGYDPRFESFSAGRVLFKTMLADSFARGDLSFDLGPQVTAWKKSWMTEAASSVRYCCYRTFSWRSQLARLHHVLQQRSA